MKHKIDITLVLLFFLLLCVYNGFAGSWNNSGTTNVGCQTVTIPLNSTNIVVTLTMTGGDWDLYVRKSACPTTSTYDCRPYLGGTSTETCNMGAGNTNSCSGTFNWYVWANPYTQAGTWTLTVTWTDPSSSYCSASGGGDEYISGVQVGSINNTGSGSGGYVNYTGQSTTMNIGTGYGITITNGNGYSSDQCGIWVDWNQDGDFCDANETITVSGTPSVGPYTATITPPAGATAGNTRMRVRITYTGAVNSCGTTTYGEVEDYTINVVSCTNPSNPGNPTSNSPQCADVGVTLTRSGSPPAGVTWYWQGTSCGTSTALGSSSTYVAASSGTYYIRARDNAGGCWSPGCGSIAVTVNSLPSNPANPTAASNPACVSTTLNTMSPPAGETYYWQGTSCGTNTASPTSSTYPVSSTGTYYVRARNNTTGCWSASCGNIAVTINSLPANPANPTPAANPGCVSTTLNTMTPPGGITYYWQGTSCGTSTANPTSSTYTVSSTGTYYVRARNNTTGCWSSGCGSVAVTIDLTAPTSVASGEDQYICVNPATMAASGTGTWSVLNGTGTITTPSSPTTTVNVTNPNSSVTFRWGTTNGCGTSTDDVVITKQ